MSPAETDTDATVFCSDWHLPPEHTEHTDFFARFVDQVCADARRVFVVGDLFNAWIGPRAAARPGHEAALRALARLAEGGTRVTVLRGNRDFLLDRKVGRAVGFELAGNVWRGSLGGITVRASHGDELTTDDRLHKAARAVCEHFPVSTLVKAAPLWLGDVLADAYRWLSDRRHSRRTHKHLEPDPARLRAEFESGTDAVVIGHWHRPELLADALGLPGKSLVRLGECTGETASYAELRRDTFRMKTFPAD
ncbi:MAG: UDP-2,3-diacylglucosamine diphosphatase [Planctomycetota bacterium]